MCVHVILQDKQESIYSFRALLQEQKLEQICSCILTGKQESNYFLNC